MGIKMVFADDQEVVRTAIAGLLEDSDIEIVAEASTGSETLRLVAEYKPDVVLLDVRMPDGDGLQVLGRIRLDQPDLPILLFSHYDNPAFIARAAAMGANGICSRPSAATYWPRQSKPWPGATVRGPERNSVG